METVEHRYQAGNSIRKEPKLIILAGLPGTGKTTLARLLSRELSLVYLRLDCIEAPFSACHPNACSNGEGYRALVNVARENLKLGHGVIIDTVNPLHLSRAMFISLSEEMNAEAFQFELKVKNILLHKKRVEERKPDIPDHSVPTWQDVLNREYEEWDKNKDGSASVIWMDDSEHAFLKCLGIIRNSQI